MTKFVQFIACQLPREKDCIQDMISIVYRVAKQKVQSAESSSSANISISGVR